LSALNDIIILNFFCSSRVGAMNGNHPSFLTRHT